ncbi:hypothetical protein CBL_03130 [Carabus blaptoides fortunei]
MWLELMEKEIIYVEEKGWMFKILMKKVERAWKEISGNVRRSRKINQRTQFQCTPLGKEDSKIGKFFGGNETSGTTKCESEEGKENCSEIRGIDVDELCLRMAFSLAYFHLLLCCKIYKASSVFVGRKQKYILEDVIKN